MGGTWDATNVADAAVAVVLPIAIDHARYLGDTAVQIALEKAGIIKPGSAAVLAEQTPEVAAVLQRADRRGRRDRGPRGHRVRRRCPDARRRRPDAVAAGAARALRRRLPAACTAPTRRRTPPWRWPRSRRSRQRASQELDADLVRAAFAEVTSPGRLEIIRRSPTIVLDAAHNPHGAEALGAALEDSFTFSPLIGVIGVMADKDQEQLLVALEPHLAHVVCTQNSTDRALPAEQLAVVAREVFGEDRVSVTPDLADAIEAAATLAEAGEAFGEGVGSGAVLVTGSVVTVGEARSLLVRRR